VATIARFFPLRPPRSANFNPQPQITVRTKRSQNVLRSLHRQRSQIRNGNPIGNVKGISPNFPYADWYAPDGNNEYPLNPFP
jgi:hypothetical protein